MTVTRGRRLPRIDQLAAVPWFDSWTYVRAGRCRMAMGAGVAISDDVSPGTQPAFTLEYQIS
jgi:hypothetical protein